MHIAESSGACGNRPSRFKDFARVAACFAMAAQLTASPLTSAESSGGSRLSGASAKGAPDPILKVMQGELARATAIVAEARIRVRFIRGSG